MLRVGWLCICVLLAPSFVAAQELPSPIREITTIRDGLYRASDGGHITLFLVTGDGIVLADPLNAPFARWLKSELEARFPMRPVRYVLYTGHAYERTAGATVFDARAEIVAHQGFVEARRSASRSLPDSWVAFDRNHDSIIERSEAAALGADALKKDLNDDGQISAAEAWSDVLSPKKTFSTREVIDIGGQRVELLHPGNGLGSDATVILFSAQRVLFAPAVRLHEAPLSFAPATPTAFIDSLQQLERLQFDTAVSGSGETGTVGDFALVREYVEALVAGARAGFRQGRTVEEIQASLDLNRFSQLRFIDERRGRNIAEAYQVLRGLSIDAIGAAQAIVQPRATPNCAASAIASITLACEGLGGRTFAGMGGGVMMVGRIGAAVEVSQRGELTGHEQTFGSSVFTSTQSETATAFMFRYQVTQTRRVGVVATAGLARVSATQQTDTFFLRGYTTQSDAIANVVGADLVLAPGRVRLLVPIRLRYEPAQLFPNAVGGDRWSFAFGVGLAVHVAHVVM